MKHLYRSFTSTTKCFNKYLHSTTIPKQFPPTHNTHHFRSSSTNTIKNPAKTINLTKKWHQNSQKHRIYSSHNNNNTNNPQNTQLHTIPKRFRSVPVPENKNVFDREVKLAQKRFAANLSNSEEYDYLRLEIANRIVSRLLDLDREYPIALDLGSNSGQIYKELINYIKSFPQDKRPGGIKSLYQKDMCSAMLLRDEIAFQDNLIIDTKEQRFAGSEESLEEFKDEQFDLVVSSMSLQWNNDLRRCFKEVLRVLKPDGAFIGAFVGGNTLQELRSSLVIADTERRGGLGSHMPPMVKVRDIGDLLSQCGFALVTTDSEVIEIPYPNMFVLLEHLHGSGDSNCTYTRDKYVSKDVFISAAAAYDAMYNNEESYRNYLESMGLDEEEIKAQMNRTHSEGESSGSSDSSVNNEVNEDLPDSLRMSKELKETINEDTTVIATFEIIFFIAWSPHESQQKPLERGSAQASFHELGQETESVEELIERKEREKAERQKNKDNKDNKDNMDGKDDDKSGNSN